MDHHTADEMREALRPIASLIGKSEKARQKLAPGSWQHTMLSDNIRALSLATALMSGDEDHACDVEREDLPAALAALASMIGRTEKALAMFPPGTSQHTLQRNRLNALRVAEAVTRAEWDRG